jgi:hypothetical protein
MTACTSPDSEATSSWRSTSSARVEVKGISG